MKSENITLHFQQGSSNKVYKASLEEKDELYTVNFAYGRVGSTLKTGTKTQSPVDYEKAKKIYDKLVNSKASKGYVATESSTNYTYESDKEQTNIHCQLLNPIEIEELQDKLEDDNWVLQEKMDGRRLLIQKVGDRVTAINRKGFSVGAPETIINWAKSKDFDFLIDGEAINDQWHVFDIWKYHETDCKPMTFSERYSFLEKLDFNEHVLLVDIFENSNDKKNAFDKIKGENKEGVVLKDRRAEVSSGRPNSGGNQLKFKFYDTCSVVVEKVNDKRSVSVKILDKDKWVNIGNVTISANKEIPKENSVIEVRYLYAYKEGSLYQPTYLGERTDIDTKECLIGQLKYKAS